MICGSSRRSKARRPQPYTTAPFDQVYGAFSPDGRTIAYASNESGQFDIYVDSFPKPGARVRVTTAGGTEPRWSNDGRELFFRRGSAIHGVRFANERESSRSPSCSTSTHTIRAFDVSRDGTVPRQRCREPANRGALTTIVNTLAATMKIATWNVNGIRARQGQLLDWLAAEQARHRLPAGDQGVASISCHSSCATSTTTGATGTARRATRASALLIRKSLAGALPVCSHPGFDFEQRIACATVPSPAGDVMVASVYVPNGGKDFDAKMRFLLALESFVAEAERDGKLMILCGDLNVALDRARHPSRSCGSRIRSARGPRNAP